MQRVIVSLVVLAGYVYGAEMGAAQALSPAVREGPRLALVIGNDNYQNSPLKNARNDARSMAAALGDAGFTVELSLDTGAREMEEVVGRFVNRLSAGATALVFYAGHGIQIEGDNYLLPVDFEARDETEARFRAYSASRLFERVANRGVALQILILDACRDNPFRVTRSGVRGLAPMAPAQKGSLIAFSTAPGGVANDNPQGINGVFTAQLLETMFEPGLGLEELFLRVRQKVNRITNGRQIPWTNSSILESFSFRPGSIVAASTSPDNDAREVVFWEVVNGTDAPELLESYLKQYPAGRFVTLAKIKLALLRESGGKALSPVSAARPRRSVAISGFRNLTGREDVNWIGAALSESLSVELGLGEHLRVLDSVVGLSSENAGNLAGTGNTNRVAGTALQNDAADVTISGSYLVLSGANNGRQVRVNATVLGRGQASPVSTFSETAGENELIDLIARIGERIRRTLQLPLRNDDETAVLASSLPPSVEGNQLYADAVENLRRFDAGRANELLVRLTAQEPSFALGHLRLAQTWSSLGFDSRARATVSQARELAAGLPREQRLLIDLDYFKIHSDWPKAIDVGRALVGFFPDNVDYAIQLAELQMSGGEPKAALERIESLRIAVAAARTDARVDVVEAEAARAVSEYERSQQVANRAARAGIERGASQLAARARLTEAWAWKRLGRLDESGAANEEARRLYAAAGDRSGMAAAILQLASDLREQGAHDRAAALFQEAIELSRAIGDRRRLAAASNNLAGLFYAQRRLPEALSRYQEALTIFREVQEAGSIAAALNNVATVLYDLGRPDDALPLDREALQLRRDLGAPRGIGLSLANMAESSLDRVELYNAISMYEEARGIFEKLNDQRRVTAAMHGLATVRFWQGLLDDARQEAMQVLELRTAVKDVAGAAETQLLIARVDRARGRCEDALAGAEQVRASGSLGPTSSVAASAVMVDALTCLGEFERAQRESATATEAAPNRILVELMAARVQLRLAERRYSEAADLLQRTQEIAKSLQSRLWMLVADVLALESAHQSGRLSSSQLQGLQQTAAAAGVGLLIPRIQRLVNASVR